MTVVALTSCAPASDKNMARDQDDVSFFVLVKSSNYSQDANETLTFLNNHMFSEIFTPNGAELKSATLTRHDDPANPMAYFRREGTYYIEGGHFDSEAELDAAFPNGDFIFDIELQDRAINTTMNLSGPGGNTDIPEPITITYYQNDTKVSPAAIDPSQKLTVRWSKFSNGRRDPNGIVDDMIFVVMADCYGERIIHTGLPFEGEYTKYIETEISVEGEFLKTGHPYSIFVEFPHVVDSSVTNGVPGFTSYATATYMEVFTSGPDTSAACPVDKVPMDTGQTNRMEIK